jgi:hypothetical protein
MTAKLSLRHIPLQLLPLACPGAGRRKLLRAVAGDKSGIKEGLRRIRGRFTLLGAAATAEDDVAGVGE